MKWIKAKIKPKNIEELLVCTRDGSFYFAEYSLRKFSCIEGGCTHLGMDDGDAAKVVTHWMYISDIDKPD